MLQLLGQLFRTYCKIAIIVLLFFFLEWKYAIGWVFILLLTRRVILEYLLGFYPIEGMDGAFLTRQKGNIPMIISNTPSHR
jgi:hypothetical protein